MRKLTTLALLAASGFLFAADGNSTSATADAFVRIVAPVKMVKSSDISFGAIVVDDLSKDAFVTMTTNHQAGQLNSVANLSDWKDCAPYKGSRQVAAVSGAGFHYNFDNWAAKTNDAGIQINVPATVTLNNTANGRGPACELTTKTDLPADPCNGVAGLPTAISGYTTSKHFSVGGTLKIPAGALGEKQGTLTVTVQYI